MIRIIYWFIKNKKWFKELCALLFVMLMLVGCGQTAGGIIDVGIPINSEKTINMNAIIITDNIILKNSNKGFDADFVAGPRVYFENGQYYLYYTGGIKTDVRGRESLAVATSQDGITWERQNNPVFELGASPAEYDYLRNWGHGTIIHDAAGWKMWQCGNDTDMARVGYATSQDGINWQKYQGQYAGAVLWDRDGKYSGIWEFAVLQENNKYYAWYAIEGCDEIRLAESNDGINWEINQTVLTGISGVGNVIRLNGVYYLTTSLPNNSEVEIYQSFDKIHWTKNTSYRIENRKMYSPFLFQDKNGSLKLFYTSSNIDSAIHDCFIGVSNLGSNL